MEKNDPHYLGDNACLIDTFLNRERCQQLLALAEQQGFTPADVQMKSGRAHWQDIRNNERVNYFSEALAEELWQRLAGWNLPHFDNRPPVGLSPHWRFYKYLPGHKFNFHKDGQQQVGELTSEFTLLIYLNDVSDGGATLLRAANLAVRPQCGRALLFEHSLWHSGEKLLSGVKYVLRSDVLFANQTATDSRKLTASADETTDG